MEVDDVVGLPNAPFLPQFRLCLYSLKIPRKERNSCPGSSPAPMSKIKKEAMGGEIGP